MSKPYFRINSVTYSTSNKVLTMNYTFYKLRGGGTVNILGLSNSISFTETNSYAPGGALTKTFSVNTLGTSSTATHNNPNHTWTFGGTPSATSNVKFFVGGTKYADVTSSGSDLTTFMQAIYASFSTSTNRVYATTSTTGNTASFTIYAPYGGYYNGTAVTASATRGSGGATLNWTSTGGSSQSATFSGGVTTYNIVIDYPKLGDSCPVYSGLTSGSNI